jgi:hypothetical protein
MAGLLVSQLNAAKRTINANTTTTILQIAAPTNQKLRVFEASISFDGVTAADAKILVEHVADATTGGTGTAVTPQKVNGSDGETIQQTGKEAFTVEPTGGRVIFKELIHPQAGYTWRGHTPVKGAGAFGIRVTTGAQAATMVARVLSEE